jgi:NCAIR mutase (PurE)-related protein
VPTSVGYGASFGGLAALLGMLNSCASGVTVVNIDNGFGAGYAASLMNQLYEEAVAGANASSPAQAKIAETEFKVGTR